MNDGFALRDVTLSLGEATLLRDIDVDLPRGSWTLLLGPSGSGKTTLLRLLNRLADPTGGEVRWLGRPLAALDVRALRRDVQLVFQQPRLSAGSGLDNVRLPVALGAIDARQFEQRRDEACEVARLDDDILARDVTQLSGGERQRVALARALVLEPEALLLDEPVSALDPSLARQVMDGLSGLVRQRALTVVMITHRVAEVRDRADRAVVLSQGRVVEQGEAARVLDAPHSEITRDLLGKGGQSGARAD